MCLVSLPLSIMENYPLYFQLISSSQIHILQFKLLRNTEEQTFSSGELQVSAAQSGSRFGNNKTFISVRYFYSTNHTVFVCREIKAEAKQSNLPCSCWKLVLVSSPGADRRYNRVSPDLWGEAQNTQWKIFHQWQCDPLIIDTIKWPIQCRGTALFNHCWFDNMTDCFLDHRAGCDGATVKWTNCSPIDCECAHWGGSAGQQKHNIGEYSAPLVFNQSVKVIEVIV